jgi:hypothetical protein
MDLTKEILFSTEDIAESTLLELENNRAVVNEEEEEGKTEPLGVSIELESDEIIIEHNLDTVIIDIKKIKDLTVKGILTKFKDNLGIVTKISSDYLTVLENNVEISLDTKVKAQHSYIIYTEHQLKG